VINGRKQVGKNKTYEQEEALDGLVDQGLIDEVVGVVKSGKEATVYACRSRGTIVAAKVYRATQVRQFANDAVYRSGRTRGSSRLERGVRLKTRTGRDLRFSQWTASEYETLHVLHAAGADVPVPLGHAGAVIVMQYIGDDDGPAPALNAVALQPHEAQGAFERIMRNIELMLACDRVHGDLSPFNVLWDGARPVLIDFPQAVDARFNVNALPLLERDIDRICAHFARLGVAADAPRLARDLWARFLRAEL
jgi:RIO kinase 1